MANNISEEDIRRAIEQVKHPAIARTLVELGIVKDITVKANKVNVTLAFPFPNIPIKDYLINSVRDQVTKLGGEAEVKITQMSQEEIQRFLALEQEAWEGGV